MLKALWAGLFLMLLVCLLDREAPSSSQWLTASTPDKTAAATVKNFRTAHAAFDWNDVQAVQGVKGKCGADKCFWHSTSDPENVGYLIASAKYHWEPMKKAYDFAVDVLESKCNAKHLFLEPPQKVKVWHTLVGQLNKLRHNEQGSFVKEKGEEPRKVLERDVFEEDDNFVVVQKVRVAPKPHLMFGFMASKWTMMCEKEIPRFRSELLASGFSLSEIETKLEAERRGVECAMQHSDTYWYDLQGLIDIEGNYFHIDIDSQYWVEISETKTGNDLKTVTNAMAFKRRHVMIGKFNEMIQRLVFPPPERVGELDAWGAKAPRPRSADGDDDSDDSADSDDGDDDY
jgi:hypothetical protein